MSALDKVLEENEALKKMITPEIKSKLVDYFAIYKDKDDEKSNTLKREIQEQLKKQNVRHPLNIFLKIRFKVMAKRLETEEAATEEMQIQEKAVNNKNKNNKNNNKNNNNNNNKNNNMPRSQYKTLSDYIKVFAAELGIEESVAKTQLETSAAYPVLQALGEILQTKEAQNMLPPMASIPLYRYFYERSAGSDNKAESAQFLIGTMLTFKEVGELATNAIELMIDTKLGLVDKRLAELGPITKQMIDAVVQQNKFKNNNNIKKARFDYDDYYSYYAGDNDMDLFAFNYNDRGRVEADRFDGYDYSDYYNHYNYGGRNELYGSRGRDRNLYHHRRQLQEIDVFGDYMVSLPMILLFVFVILMAVIGIVAYRHKRKDGEDKMLVIQAKNNEENQV